MRQGKAGAVPTQRGILLRDHESFVWDPCANAVLTLATSESTKPAVDSLRLVASLSTRLSTPLR